MICTGMSGNGARTGTPHTTARKKQLVDPAGPDKGASPRLAGVVLSRAAIENTRSATRLDPRSRRTTAQNSLPDSVS